MRFEKMKWNEIELEAKKETMLVLPVGSVEQHGYHLPVDTDINCALYVAKKAVERTDTLLLPPIYYSYVEYALDFPGTVSVDAITFINYIVGIAVSLWKTGFKKMLLINGHGGNVGLITTASGIISEKTDMIFAATNWYSMGTELYNKEREVKKGENAHAADYETDVMYYIDPSNVDKSKAVKEMGGPLTDYTFWDLGLPSPAILLTKWKYYTKSGVLGDPTKSTAEKGKRWVEFAIDRVVDFIEILKKLEIDSK